MRFAFAALLAFPAVLPAVKPAGNCATPFVTSFEAGRHLTMRLRAGDYEIVGVDSSEIRVKCANEREQTDVKISLAAGDLRVYGGSGRDLRIRIEIPRTTDLVIRLTAGDMSVTDVTGDKDVELKAGDLTISVDRPEDYRVAEGSVMAGDLRADAFGINKDGLFRHFRKDNPKGRYRLRAELMAGDLTLR
jgi:hypothetical protein